MRVPWVMAMVASAVLAHASPAVGQDHHHGHGSAATCGGLEPLLTVADFNGDGAVDGADRDVIVAAVARGEYLAFYDRNADETLDNADVELTAQDSGKKSSALDREVIAAFWGTKHLRDQAVAIAEGWIPTTQEYIGHGVHWGLLGGGGGMFEAGRPRGLNYSAEGELLAVYYTTGAVQSSDVPYPEGFAGDEDLWHSHVGVCLGGVNPYDPIHDHTAVSYGECLSRDECSAATGSEYTIWVPKIHMLHLWLYTLNPCGKFGGTHPGAGLGGVEPSTTTCALEDVLK